MTALSTSECSIDGCTVVALHRGWCRHHYESNLRYGNPLTRRWMHEKRHEPVVCECPTPTPEHIRIFDAWQCTTCYRKCEPPT